MEPMGQSCRLSDDLNEMQVMVIVNTCDDDDDDDRWYTVCVHRDSLCTLFLVLRGVCYLFYKALAIQSFDDVAMFVVTTAQASVCSDIGINQQCIKSNQGRNL